MANTGRPRCEIGRALACGLDGSCCSAGADVVVGNNLLVREPLDALLARETARALSSLGCDFVAECQASGFLNIRPELRETLSNMVPGDDFFEKESIDAMTEKDWGDVFKFSLLSNAVGPELIEPALDERLHLTHYGYSYEVSSRRFSKATAVSVVRARYPEFRTVAVGDSANDLPMFQTCDVAICMGNGTPEAKAAADYVTESLEDDGLFHAFERLGLLR